MKAFFQSIVRWVRKVLGLMPAQAYEPYEAHVVTPDVEPTPAASSYVEPENFQAVGFFEACFRRVNNYVEFAPEWGTEDDGYAGFIAPLPGTTFKGFKPRYPRFRPIGSSFKTIDPNGNRLIVVATRRSVLVVYEDSGEAGTYLVTGIPEDLAERGLDAATHLERHQLVKLLDQPLKEPLQEYFFCTPDVASA